VSENISWKSKVKNAAQRAGRSLFLQGQYDKLLIAQGALCSRQLNEVARVDTLADVEFSIFSQWGEDGIIEWLVQRLGNVPESFVEFGVEDYREANTRFLIAHRNWRGMVIDGDSRNVEAIRNDAITHQRDLIAACAFVTAENIEALIADAGLTGEIGLLSIDIDGNDYWVWKAIENVRPQIVIVEYNAVFGDLHDLVIPYDAAFVRTKGHYSNLYWGASIGAFARLGHEKGYTLIGSNRAGSNAFFVRDDRASLFAEAIVDKQARPSRFRESRDNNHNLSLLRGKARANPIAECAVIDLQAGATVRLDAFEALYGERWLRAIA